MKITGIELSDAFENEQQIIDLIKQAESKLKEDLLFFIREIEFTPYDKEYYAGYYFFIERKIQIYTGVHKNKAHSIRKEKRTLFHELKHVHQHLNRVVNHYNKTIEEFEAEEFANYFVKDEAWKIIKKRINYE